MQLVQTVTLSSSAASISFTGIPQTGTDLVLLVSARTNAAGEYRDYLNIRFNGSTSGYTSRSLTGNGTSVSRNSFTNTDSGYILGINGDSSTSNTFGSTKIYIPNYASTNQKAFFSDTVSENNAANAGAEINAGLWTGTAAITSITLTRTFGTLFIANSSASLYLITKA